MPYVVHCSHHLNKLSDFGTIQELCGKGGVLFLAQAILKLKVMPHFVECARVVAAVSRLKAKVLSIVSHKDRYVFKHLVGGARCFRI